ncbi:MAG: glycosyltransferase, partial [Sulfurovum sp.]
MKKILELCLSPDLGGLEIFVTDCFLNFTDLTDTHLIIEQNSKLDQYIKDKKKAYLKRNKFLPIFPALHLAHYIDKNGIDIIHFHWTKDIATVVLAKIFSKQKPKIIQTRHMTMTRFKDDFYHKWLYKNIDMIHAVTYQVKSQLEKFIPFNILPKIEMVYLGCENTAINYTKIEELRDIYNIKDEFVVGIIGRIE